VVQAPVATRNARSSSGITDSVDGGSFRAGQPRPWPESHQSSGLNVWSFALHPDGNRLAVPAAGETATPSGWERFDVALNFFDELRRIAPAQTR
jgi:hypothetical protein